MDTTTIRFDEPFLRRLERLSVLSRRAMAGRTKGERRSVHKGTSTEFADFRPYVHGDDLRQIDWHIYARLERLFLKLFEEEEDITLHLLVDCSQSMDAGTPNKLTYALRVAGALGYLTLANLDHVGVAAIGGDVHAELPPTRGRAQSLRIFDYLEQQRPLPGGTDLTRSLEQYARRHGRPGLAIILSDLLAPGGYEAGLKQLLARRYQVVVIQVLSDEELEPQLGGDLRLRDRETGDLIEITVDGRILDLYRRNLNRWFDDISAFCGKHQITYVRTSTSADFEDFMLHYLRTRGVLGT